MESNSDLVVVEGTVYPLLNRLRTLGLVESEWVESDFGHPRKYYRLTAAGRQRALEMTRIWVRFSASMTNLLAPLNKEIRDRDKRRIEKGNPMTFSAESQKTIDAYLLALRKQLRELMDEDVNDIVEEIRAHILDKTSGEGRRIPSRPRWPHWGRRRNWQAAIAPMSC